MANWDSADLLLRMQRYIRRPATDVAVNSTDLYALLTEAEAEEKSLLVVHNPGPMLTVPTLLTSADGGLTYDLPSSAEYIYVELYPSLNAATPLREGPYHSVTHDYTLEGTRIRMCRSIPRTFTDGPYFRGVTPPGSINGSGGESTIFPVHHRVLVLFSALRKWATITGWRDPEEFQREYQKALTGDPRVPGDLGILGSIKKRDPRSGTPAGESRRYWHVNG